MKVNKLNLKKSAERNFFLRRSISAFMLEVIFIVFWYESY